MPHSRMHSRNPLYLDWERLLNGKRYEKGSVIITSNRPFEEWGNIFGVDVVAAAILDGLLHRSYPFLIQVKSYRW